MTADYTAAMRESEEAASGPFAGFVDQIVERVGGKASAKAVFGEPVEREGVTVIPVAKVRWAFGGGGGSGAKEDDDESDRGQGAGGGGMVSASPLGFIEIREGRAEFRQVTDIVTIWPLVVAGAVSSWILLRGLRALFR